MRPTIEEEGPMSDITGGAPPPPPPPPPSGGAGGQLPARTLGDILSTAFEVYKANAAKLITIVAIVVVPLALIGSLLANVVFAAETDEVTIGGETVTTIVGTRGLFATLAATMITAALAFVMAFVLQAAVARAAAQAVIGDPVDAEASYRYGFKRLGSVILIALLSGVIIFVGFLLLVIPGIIFAVFLSLAIPALVVENRRGTDALGRSWNLVSGHFWHVLGTIFVAGLITGVIGSIFGAIGGTNVVLSWIFTAIGQIITTPFTALVAVVLYLDVRARRESLTAETLRAEIAAGA
jgi:hypothetical protein